MVLVHKVALPYFPYDKAGVTHVYDEPPDPMFTGFVYFPHVEPFFTRHQLSSYVMPQLCIALVQIGISLY